MSGIAIEVFPVAPGATGTWRAFELDPPLEDRDDWDEDAEVTLWTHVIVSAAVVPFSGAETYVFGAMLDHGKWTVSSFSELAGSYRGGLDHEHALELAGYLISIPPPEVKEIEPPKKVLSDESDQDECGGMQPCVEHLAEAVVGHRIVAVERGDRRAFLPPRFWPEDEPRWEDLHGLILTLDNGTEVVMEETSDCCAFTELKAFLLHPDRVDHIITSVSTEDGYDKWHIVCDMGDVLELTVSWSEGNPCYYGYGFDIRVIPLVVDGEVIEETMEIASASKAITCATPTEDSQVFGS